MANHKILTTHVGSLPRPQTLLEANRQLSTGEISEEKFQKVLANAVEEVLKRQEAIGLDIVNEGEYGHFSTGKVDYGAWWNYSFYRLGGLLMTDEDRWAKTEDILSAPGKIRLTNFRNRRDRKLFQEAYEDTQHGVLAGRSAVGNPVFNGPITYIGQDAVKRDVDLLCQSMQGKAFTQGFMASLSPGSAARLEDRYYHDEKALLNACADAMHEEYKAITDAGLIVQLDAPDMAEAWDQINPEPTVKDFQDWLQLRIDAANRALNGINPDLVRLHICWGSWHGPHTTDIPLKEIVNQCLQVNASSFSFEAASPRHAHEWKIWKDVALKPNQKLVPGFISHSTNAVEHPEWIADRICQFAEVVGSDNVIASTDCGLGGRIHEQIAWAKLAALVEGAAIATKRLYG